MRAPLLLALLLAACGPGGGTGGDLTAEIITVYAAAPANPAPGECWDSDVIPAVIESETVQRLVTPEVRDASGTLVTPAAYKSVTHLRMVQDRSQVWFRVPCPEVENAAFWASLQRALKARGYFMLPISGLPDADTAEALRRFQAARGLDSAVLSLAAAQDLGLVAVPVDQL